MPVLASETPIRVLVDHYHDAGEQYIRTSLRGGFVQPTVCRQRLTWGVLKRYHVAIIDATAPMKVAATELSAIERFVAEGGGLLIAGAAPQYELVTGEPPEEMPAQRFAGLFGFGFLPAGDARGETRIDPDFRIGYRDEDVEAVSGAIDGFGPHPPGMETCAPLSIPDDARPLLVHAQTGEPLAAVAEHGAGRVCVSASPLTRFNVLAHLQPLLDWLAADAGERPGRDVPAEIGPPPTVRTVQGLKLVSDGPVAERAEDLAALVRRLDEFMAQLVGERWQPLKSVHFAQSSHRPRPWEDDDFVPASGPEWPVAWGAAITLIAMELGDGPQAGLLVSLFPELTVARHIALRFLDHLGYTDEADRLRGRATRALEQTDPSRTEADLARVYWATQKWHPKGHWLLAELEDRRAQRAGDDFLRRLFDVLPKKREDDRLPRHYAGRADRLAYYMGLAAGEDVTGLLREIGTTIHPLPLVPHDDDGFDETMRGVLVGAVSTASASRRMEALGDLAALKPEERAKLPDRVRELAEAFGHSAVSDVRAVKPLEKLARGKDAQAAAWAALQLLSMGRTQWADRLAELLAALLPDRDLRFRLMAGHALHRIGREVPEAMLEGLVEGGERAGELNVMTRDLVMVHPKIEGYEVANVLAEAGLCGFPHGNVATQFYVYWVHTHPQWRRSGLSRLAFAAAMEHPEAQRCSCFALNTGTRNNAHALYSEFGYVDMERREQATKQLHAGTPATPPDGVVIRPIADVDRDAVRRFVRDYHCGAFALLPLPVPDLGEGTFTSLAERDGKLIGVALAKYGGGDGAELQDVAVAEDEEGRPSEQRSPIGVALLARAHAMLAEAGAKRVSADICSDVGLLTDVLCRAGYSRATSGGVNMFGIRDLAQLFGEIRPLYERRLRETPFEDWRGRVLLLGGRLRAGLEIEEGAARVLDAPKPSPTDLVLQTTDETITRIVTGRETPLEGYLQRRTTVGPQVSPGVMKLLETLFPQVPFVVRWGW